MKKKIAFICVHNSCRSQIAEALGLRFMGDKYEKIKWLLDISFDLTATKPKKIKVRK